MNAGAPNLKESQQPPWEQLLACTVVSSYSLITCRGSGGKRDLQETCSPDAS